MSNLDNTIAEGRKIIGQMLKEQREKMGMSRTGVGMRCGLNHSQVKAIEEASSAFTIDSLMKLAYGMNCQLHIVLDPKKAAPDEHNMEQLEEKAKKLAKEK